MSSRPLSRDILSDILFQSGCLMRTKVDGTIEIVDADTPGSVTRNVAEAEIWVDDNYMAQWSHSRTSADNLITGIELWYKPILPLNDSYSGRCYCQRTDFGGTNAGEDNFASAGSTYQGYLQSAYDVIQVERQKQIKCPGIRDAATAEALAKVLIKWHYKYLATMDLTCRYSVVDIDQWDKIGVTADFLPAMLQSKTWLVTAAPISPNVGQEPEVRLSLLEMP